MYDVVIVGGGIAGLSAAILLARSLKTVAIIDAGKTRNSSSSHAHGFFLEMVFLLRSL